MIPRLFGVNNSAILYQLKANPTAITQSHCNPSIPLRNPQSLLLPISPKNALVWSQEKQFLFFFYLLDSQFPKIFAYQIARPLTARAMYCEGHWRVPFPGAGNCRGSLLHTRERERERERVGGSLLHMMYRYIYIYIYIYREREREREWKTWSRAKIPYAPVKKRKIFSSLVVFCVTWLNDSLPV